MLPKNDRTLGLLVAGGSILNGASQASDPEWPNQTFFSNFPGVSSISFSANRAVSSPGKVPAAMPKFLSI